MRSALTYSTFQQRQHISERDTPIMSLASSIKEFSDRLNELNGILPTHAFLFELFISSVRSGFSGLFYLVSFQWFRDFSYLPLLAPQMNPSSSYFEPSFFEETVNHFFSFSRTTGIQNSGNPGWVLGTRVVDPLISGFVNSFFFSLPFSLPHLVSIRRLFSQGSIAAASSVLGQVIAHSLFLLGVLYGLRFLIIPWFALEPLNYIVGLFVVGAIINEMVLDKNVYLMPSRQKPSLIRIGILSFLLTWCEEVSVFHSLNHLTLNAQNTYLDLYPAGSALDNFLVHTVYLLAFIIGNVGFLSLFYYFILKSGQYISLWTHLSLAKVVRTINKLVLFLIVAFTLSSFPYYGLDYLFGKIGGFLPEDPAYMESVLSPTLVRTLNPHFKEAPPMEEKKRSALSLDISYFDHGVYLNTPSDEKIAVLERPDSTDSMPSFEELNYRGEYAWTLRDQHTKRAGKGETGLFAGAFKQPKNHYMELKQLSDKKRAEAEKRAHTEIPPGQTSSWSQGVLPGEPASLLIRMGLNDKVTQAFLEPLTPNSWLEKGGNSQMPAIPETQNRKANKEKISSILNGKPMSYGSMTQEDEKWRDVNQDLFFENEEMSEYSKGITEPAFPEIEEEREKLLPIENLIKNRYLFNPVYRTLLRTDIDAFLARQPAAHKMAENQEYDLYKKRQVLERYYNWLRYYAPFEKDIERLYDIPETKSFVDSIYHQQFKGTLKVARRLFSVNFENAPDNPSRLSQKSFGYGRRRVLSFDQHLYKNSGTKSVKNSDTISGTPNNKPQPYDADLQQSWVDGEASPFIHEELAKNNTGTKPSVDVSITKRSVLSHTPQAPSLGESHRVKLNEVQESPRNASIRELDAPCSSSNRENLVQEPSKRGVLPTRSHNLNAQAKTDRSTQKQITEFEDLDQQVPLYNHYLCSSKTFSSPEEDQASYGVKLGTGTEFSDNQKNLKTKQRLARAEESSVIDGKRENDKSVNSPSRMIQQKPLFAERFAPAFDPSEPFIEESSSSPMYAGWDETLRRFVVTNKLVLQQNPTSKSISINR